MSALLEKLREKVTALGPGPAAELFDTTPNKLRQWLSGATAPPFRIAEQLVAEDEFTNFTFGPTDTPAPGLPVVEWTPDASIAVAMLGRFGDIISILPVCRYIYENYGKPSLVCSREFASVLEGVSYVTPFPLDIPNSNISDALTIARREFPCVLNAQMWGQGFKWEKISNSFDEDQWFSLGMARMFNSKLPLVFDKRDYERETVLRKSVFPKTTKPVILVNVTAGKSSAFMGGAELFRTVQKQCPEFAFVDLGAVQAERIYDLLGLYERAAALVTIDTGTVHLAAATSLPVISLIGPKGWGAARSRANIVARFLYNTTNLSQKIGEAIKRAQPGNYSIEESIPALKEAPVRKIFHVVDMTCPGTDDRRKFAQDSWKRHYDSGAMIPVHVTQYRRTANNIGDRRALPYLKDVLKAAMDQAGPDDLIALTNDDNIFHPDAPQRMRYFGSVYEACSWRRCEFRQRQSMTDSRETWASRNVGHVGRDLFVFQKKWLTKYWDEIPDYILGASEWDYGMGLMLRDFHKIRTSWSNQNNCVLPAELGQGIIGHEAHAQAWAQPDNVDSAPSQVHNRKLVFDYMNDGKTLAKVPRDETFKPLSSGIVPKRPRVIKRLGRRKIEG